ncbi:hypothetical protein IDJ77_05480 [Mucilaginibacter sp. ZT4R22]|uniref:NACHT domain-containing protein n=1 Tax=Mucilaginibacter pankratovii TaxID=2772110 RepID=A0ABR7WM67_9SPHI|nr:hypothetical protein [Mucilaginibacter pankratovii]MBD1363258.1 hypothetical protein [Mucilaginibacter pankratovii]
MTTFLTHSLEALKSAVLLSSGFKSIAPGDCKVISLKVFERTKHSISETTLKRVYGFAYSKFRPSLFTIETMAKYCGYEGWDDFCLKQEIQHAGNNPTNANWETLKQNAAKITNFTVQALQNKAGIPYAQTIQREFIDRHFAAFSRGDHTATVLSAPAGYGKTIALCHWVEEALALNASGITNDVVLFFSSSALMNVFLSGRSLNDWLLGLLGYATDVDLRSLFDNDRRKEGNFYLIIDGLDDHSYKSEQFQLLLSQVNDIAALHQNTGWFKLILTMRAATWVNNKHQLQNNPDNWYTAFTANNSHLEINVPLFSAAEIKELCKKINPGEEVCLAEDIAENFNHPLYFQFYYKQHKDDFSLNNINHVCLYELLSAFVLNKVYLGPYSADKLLLLTALVELMDFKNGVFEVDKLKVNGLIKQCAPAYHDLLSVGFLRELNTSANLQYHTVVEFVNSNFLELTIAKALLQKNNNAFDSKLIAQINTSFANEQRRFGILKWCVIYVTKSGQQNNLDVLANALLTPCQKSELLQFLSELFEKTGSPMINAEVLIN